MKSLFCLLAIIILSCSIFSCRNSKPINLQKTDTVAALHNNGINIAFSDTSVADTTLLFVHGWAINRSYWSNQVSYFKNRYRIVTIDLPGFGQSGGNRDKWGTREYSNDVDSVINQLQLKKVILIGHSMAGEIVLQAAIDNPYKVIGIVGVDNFKNVGVQQTEKDKKEFTDAIGQMRKNFKGVATQWFNQQLFSKTTSPEIKKRILNDVTHTDSTIATSTLEQGNDFDDLAKLQQYKQKLYLINSDVTPTGTKNMDAKKIPYQVFYTHGTGHFAMVETPVEFNKDLDRVIADINKK
ncbi:alpha/beta hydrolase [Mucilaginibacter sp.]|uniref:alpha/beta fold hydrolase n=1 Tax=Mucilaginibacter sp. TaxID=1882438 RepID=UPI00261D71FD|nr:alpha/beta hydrolase [Mucilaginibacter sp.]MDB4925118.1 hypothetical protein [Mucilaginibacter sp.]